MPQRAQVHGGCADAGGIVVVYQEDNTELSSLHERASRVEIARRLAALMSFEFGGNHDPARQYGCPVYFVPNRTLVGLDARKSAGAE